MASVRKSYECEIRDTAQNFDAIYDFLPLMLGKKCEFAVERVIIANAAALYMGDTRPSGIINKKKIEAAIALSVHSINGVTPAIQNRAAYVFLYALEQVAKLHINHKPEPVAELG